MNSPTAAARFATAAVLFGCVAAALIVYFPVLDNGFYGEDGLFLATARAAIGRPSMIFQNNFAYYRPVWFVYVTGMLRAFGAQTVPWFAAGIALHGIASFCIYRLALRFVASRATAILAAGFFLFNYAHSESVMWMAAHNSILAAIASILACTWQVDAVREKSWGKAAAAGAAGAICILTKDTGIVHLAWFGFLALALEGFRVFKNRRMWMAGAMGAVALIFYIYNTPAFQTFMRPGAPAPEQSRLGFDNITLTRIAGSFAWIFDPRAHTYEDLSILAALGVPAALVAIVYFGAREQLRTLLIGLGLAALALVPVCMSRMQTASGTRHYYVPAIGASLAVAAAVAGATGAIVRVFSKFKNAKFLAQSAIFVIFIVFAVASTRQIREFERTVWLPLTRGESDSARMLKSFAGESGNRTLFLVQSPLSNLMHAQGFLLFYFGVPMESVNLLQIEPGALPDWHRRTRDESPQARLLEWTGGAWREITSLGQLDAIARREPDRALPIVRVQWP